MKYITRFVHTVLSFCARFRLLVTVWAGAALYVLVVTVCGYGSRTRTGEPPLYSVVDLGAGASAAARSINEAGHVVGTSDGRAFFWDGTITHLQKPKNGMGSSALGINKFDQVVGYFDTGQAAGTWDEDEKYHAALWTVTRENGTVVSVLRDLHTDTSNFPSTVAQQISDSGVIIGEGTLRQDGPEWHIDESGPFFCDLQTPAAALKLIYPALSSGTNAVSTNAVGATSDIAACVQAGDPKHKYLQNVVLCRADNSKRGFSIVRNFGRIPGGLGDSMAFALNTSGEIAGTFATFSSFGELPHSDTYGNFASFYRKNHETRWMPLPGLPDLPSTTVSGMNEAGDIVGYVETDRHPINKTREIHAALWRSGAPIDLNTVVSRWSGWTLEEAYGINSKGQIVGEGIHFGQHSAFLLNPVVSASPELGR